MTNNLGERNRRRASPLSSRRRQRRIAFALLCLSALLLAIAVASSGGSHRLTADTSAGGGSPIRTATQTAPAARPKPPTAFAVGLRVIRLTDGSREITLPDGGVTPRPLVTYVRYPALGSRTGTDVRDAPAASAYGPYGLIVFAHGFNITPTPYDRLLQAWARAGYVVAAPVFPLENANAPGGANESDLINQPRDMSYVISQIAAAGGQRSAGPLRGMVDPRKIAVTGQSDGGDTALTAAYNRRFVDRRIGAAMILSGAQIPRLGGYDFPAGSPPLLAIQGTADTINLPAETETFFRRARTPKFLLSLLGAEHLPPYTQEQPQLGIVERSTLAFLDYYLNRHGSALGRFRAVARVPGIATLESSP